MKRKSILRFASLIGVLAMTALFSACAYTAPYRTTALSKNLPADHPALVALTATERRPGKRGDFFRDTRRVLDAMPGQEGLLGYSFRFQLIGSQAWTVTAWRDEAALAAFVRSPEHRTAVRNSGATAQNIRFVRLERPLETLPVPWKDILSLLETAPLRSPSP